MPGMPKKVITLWHPGNTLFLGQRVGMDERQTSTVRYNFYIQETKAIMNEEWGQISYAHAWQLHLIIFPGEATK